MRPSIQAIIFDIGGTLRVNQATGGRDLVSIKQIQKAVGDSNDPSIFAAQLREREAAYRRWCQRTLIELCEQDLWSKVMLPDCPEELVREQAVHLNSLWRAWQTKVILPDAVDTVRQLSERGYILGIISNTTSSTEGPEFLAENDLLQYFQCVYLSSTFGKRKPHPSLFLAAAKELDIAAEYCVYIGDQVSRDLIGPRQAGYGEVVIIDSVEGYKLETSQADEDLARDNGMTLMQPDFKIKRLTELLDLYPGPVQTSNGKYKSLPLFDAALSTMWGVDQPVEFNRTFEEGWQAGFARFELNHKISPALFTQWDSNRFYVNTVHDPCPAKYSTEYLKEADIMISSVDESHRREALDIAKSTIDLACRLGARSVVVHPGMITTDIVLEHKQRALFAKGMRHTAEFEEITRALIQDRARLAPKHLERVVKSMEELIAHTRGTNLELALENRYHYYDIPLPDEMQVLLDLCLEDWYGFQYDSGHAQALSVLGLCDHDEWLKRFGKRIIGTHLHDVRGITDHQLPGTGDVDFEHISRYLPPTAYRTLELAPGIKPEELTHGLEVLEKSGCVFRV